MAKHAAGETVPEPPVVVTGPMNPNWVDPTPPRSDEVPKRARPKPDNITAMKRIAALLETQDLAARMRIIAFLSSYYGSVEKDRETQG